jgi:hypothetical protein
MTHYPTDPADILEAAADLLESTGWTKGAYHRNMYNDSDDGDAQNAVSYCAAGAIRRAAGWYDHHSVPMARGTMDIEAMLAEKVGVICLPSWNDKPERKVHEVIDLLKETAKDLRNRKAAA